MAVTGIILVGFVIAHMLGNLKIFLGEEAIDSLCGRSSGRWASPCFRTKCCCGWPASSCSRSVVLHIVAAVELTRMNWAARPKVYETKRSIAATYASQPCAGAA